MWRYKNKEEKNYKDRKIFNDGIDSAHHCTLYKALWHPESTIYILAMVLINSGYFILDKKIHGLGRERELFSLFLFSKR